MRENQAADGLSALGNRTRLRLFRLLVKAGDAGLMGPAESAGDFAARLGPSEACTGVAAG